MRVSVTTLKNDIHVRLDISKFTIPHSAIVNVQVIGMHVSTPLM